MEKVILVSRAKVIKDGLFEVIKRIALVAVTDGLLLGVLWMGGVVSQLSPGVVIHLGVSFRGRSGVVC